MATQNVNIGINVSDNGTAKKVVKNFQEITQAATQAQRAAAGISVAPVKSTLVPGGTSGSRRASEPAGSQQIMSGQDYGSARGSAGLTGASARDFANQAQGLGGLVRLYATYAANIFAVSAAFSALSNAMDTANMVKGLDQLGAASGVALGTLSKELVKATDGAISLRDAMTATAKASSSGMSSEQILRMGKVAQQASQALGVDMADAISRISRGITKLEPELLDELGLFTKTGNAAEQYARSVGKSVTELTDFERRAAFANAVLEEGEKKFSKIDLDVNPYTKLLASIKDLAQVSLEFINKGLSPIVSYLSNSPTALGVAIAALGTVLIKQALPALGEFKAGLASTADRANQLAVQKAQDAGKARLAIDADILTRVEAMADDKVAAVDAAEQKIQALEASGLNKRSAAYKLLQKDIAEVTKADIDSVEARAKVAEKSGDFKRAAAYREVTSAVLEQKQAEEDLILTKQNLSKQLEKDASGMTAYGMTIRAAEKAQTAATKANIVSNAAYNGSLIGVTASMTLMRAEMQAAGIATNTFAGRLLLARGALAAVGGMVSTVMAAFGPLMLAITGISLAFSLLDGVWSKNNKEASSLAGSLDALDANTSHLTKTLDTINEKPFLERMSPESLKVKAAALSEVSSAISSTINDLLKADKAASGWDKFLDGFKTLWGGDILSKSSKGLANGITESLASIAGSPEAKSLNKELSAILKIDTETATFQQVQDAIKKIGQESPEQLKRVEEGFKRVSLASQVTAAKGTELVDAFKKLADLKQTIGNKFLPTDDVTKFGQELIASSQKLATALDDPQQKLNAIIQLGANAVEIPGITFEQVSTLNKVADLAKDIQLIEAKQLDNKQAIVSKQEELSKLIGKERAAAIASGKEVQISGLTPEGVRQVKEVTKELKDLKASGDINLKVKTELTSKLEGYSKEIENATLNTYKAGADIVAKQISAEFIKAGKVVSDAYVSIIGETEATIKIKTDSEKAVVNAQIQQILSQRDLTIATRELSLKMQQESLEKQAGLSPLDRKAAQPKLDAVNLQLEAVQAARTGDFSKLKLSTDVKDLKTLNVEALGFAQNMRASAAAVGNLQAQIKAIDIGALDAITRKKFEPEKKNLEGSEKSVSLAKQELDVQGKLVTQGNLAFLSAKQTLDTKQLELQQDIAQFDYKVQFARLDKVISGDASKAQKDAAVAKKAELKTSLETLQTQQKQQKTTLASSQAQERLGALAFNTEEARKREAENAELALAKKLEAFKVEQDLFGLYSSIGLLSETQKINQKFLLEQKSAELDYEQKISKLKTSSGQQMGQLESREEAIWTQIGTGTGDQAALIAELDRIAETKALITARTNEEASAAARVRDNTLGIAAATKAAALDQERYNGLLTSAGDFTNTLKMGFEGAAESSQKIAAALGDVATTMAQVAINADQRAKSEKLAQDNVDKAWKSMDYAKVIEAEKEQAEIKKKNAKQELADDIKTVNSTKKLFKEKTAAYKILNGIEKVMHITKLAMDAKELAVKLGSLATGTAAKAGAEAASTSLTFAGTIGRLPAYAAEIYGKTIGQLGPIAGPVVATALVAAMFAMFGKGGGKSGGGVFVPTSEQRQETQGTGMTWDSKGNKVATEGGIFGDDTAKANSITKSLEILSDNSFESLAYDNKLLRSFERVADSITGTTNAIISSGIRNIPAALQGLLGSTSSVGKDLFSKVSGFLFGSSKSSTDITSQRLELSGNFLSAANDITGSLKNVATTVTNWSTKGVLGGLFGGNRSGTTVTDNVLALPDDVRDAFNGILDNLRTGYEEIARTIGKSSSEAAMFVSERLRSVEFKDSQGKPLTFEFKDLKGDELATELNAFVSQINNISLKNLFPEFEQFKKYGEDFGTTVIKVVQGNRQVDAALRAMGSTFDVTKDKVEQVTETRKGGWFTPSATLTFNKVTTAFELSETIINKMAGSLERFTDQAKFFIDNFLTEAERMANTRADVNAALTELALPTSLTRDQFKSLVQMQDLSTQAGRDMYQGLMDIQEGFFKVTEKLEDLKSESGNLQIELLNAEGRTVEANAALRKLAIEGLTSAELAVYNYNESLKKQINVVKERAELEKKLFQLTATREQIRERELKNLNASNRGLQKEIWLREDQIAASKELTSSLQNVTSTIRSQITSLQDYKTSLLGSEKSTLTTTQQYDLARSEIEKLVSTISKPATTAEEIAVRDKAVGKLSGASDTFLGKSRELFASGAQYSTDFDLVMRTIDTVSSTIGTQLTDAEKQLKALETANTFLESISTATELTLEAITAGTAETRELALLVEKELNAGVKKLDRNLDGKLTYDELVVGLAGKATDAEIRALIKRADLNADGIIDAYELESAATAEYIVRELSSGFDLIDENLDGKLSYEELEKGLRGKATDAEIKALIKRVDKNSDELIDAYELESEAVSKSVVSMLKIIDTNLDGKLSYSELVRGLNGKATDDEIRALIQAADLNADNLISTYELELFNNAKSIIEALGSGFRMLDTNLDGKVSEAEFIKGMRGKASDEVLNNIFGLIDSDNDKLINASELNAALTAVETVETSKAISDLNNDNLLTITNNTATTVRAINQLLDNNVSLFNAMNAVAANTAALANAVKPGSGQASGSGGGGADSFLGVFGKVVDVAGNVVNAVLDSIGSAVKSVGNFVKKIFSDERTKTNISLHSRLSNGIGIYDYNYKQPYAELYGTDRKRGVLAQEVKDQYPDAVSIARNGMYMVDYSKLPVPPEMLKFAKGGIFSNQVVTRPTSFSLAQMGEAGPEAVMPLTRTSNGDLGIISQIPGIDNRNRTNEVLILEIKKLNQKIQSLEQTVAQGATMNAQATDRNTAEIAQAVVDSSGKVIQANRLQAKAGIR